MKAWSAWMPDVMPHVPNAPEPLVVQALRRSARSFLQETMAWREWLEPTVTSASVSAEYDFETPQDAEVHRLERATVNGNRLGIRVYQDTEKDLVAYGDGCPALMSPDLRAFRLLGTFAAGQKISVQATLIPTVTSAGLPEWLADKYLEPIKHEAIHRLMIVPNTPYTNLEMASYHKGQYEKLKDAAILPIYKGHVQEMPRVRPVWC
ncbi:MAG: hypothetical protein ACRCV9_15575 [Burkholderiaceae bacterium]